MQTITDANLPDTAFALEPIPARAGIGLKAQHVSEILESEADVGFFEVHAENYMGAGGLPHAQLHAIRDRYPVSLHGVGMSIGGDRAIDREHLERFKRLVEIYKPGLVSEHLAWSTHDDVFYNDLLPVPYTDTTLENVVAHVCQVQDAIGRQILIENPSTYVVFSESSWTEVEFMAEIAARSECGLLFDVNNVFVSATNHGYSPQEYIKAFPLELVQEIHLAGHATDTDDNDRPLLIDAHDREVCADVWELYRLVLSRTGPRPSLVEWDNDVPEWPVLFDEARRADEMLGRNFDVPTRKSEVPAEHRIS
ncbi:MAG: MNIO family bufferin maturase [Rhizobiaceae bacterium]